MFSFSLTGELRREEVCADSLGITGQSVMMRHCHGHRGNQAWTHFRVSNDFLWRHSEHKLQEDIVLINACLLSVVQSENGIGWIDKVILIAEDGVGSLFRVQAETEEF